MPVDFLDISVGLLGMVLGYAGADWALRGGGLVRLLRRVGLGVGDRAPLGLTALCVVGASYWPWEAVAEGGTLRWFATALGVLLTWRAATRDIDVVDGRAHGVARVVVCITALGAFWSPSLLFATGMLLTTPFGMWQHHATLPMRLLQALLAFAVLSSLRPFWPAGVPVVTVGACVFWLVVMQSSHYVITALAKGFLGPRWYSWPNDNRLHHLAASAYSWGWARFVPWSKWLSVIRVARVIERPSQWLVFLVEGCAPLALLHPYGAAGLSVAWAGFHAGVFVFSGLLFWEWIATDLLFAGLLVLLPSEALAGWFGLVPCLLGLGVMVVFPFRHKLWKPMPLGWWDTPFTQRMHWRVYGESGRCYGLYADFMDPHERIYGKVHGCFMAPMPVLTYHLGEAWRHELRDGLRASGGDLARIADLRSEFGIEPLDASLAANHRAYLERFCWELNRGARKHVLPKAMRWLKAPGGQCYYWGAWPAYRQQEPIARLEVVYKEEFFDGERLLAVGDERVVLEVAIPRGSTAPDAAVEPTPKELDDHLLKFAAGRLIRLPGIGAGLVQGDDGKGAGS